MPNHLTISSGNQQQQQQQQNNGLLGGGGVSHLAQQRQPSTVQTVGQIPNHIFISPAPPSNRDPQLIIDPGSQSMQISSQSGATNNDHNCDAHGFCYDVALKCTDTKMVVNVKTQRPFFGRIYALGRSETCNANIKNQNQFQLDMYLTGQECNTQSAVSSSIRTICINKCVCVCVVSDVDARIKFDNLASCDKQCTGSV